jgi:hypothetical protein
MQAIKPDASGLLQVLQAWEEENIHRLELEPSRIP